MDKRKLFLLISLGLFILPACKVGSKRNEEVTPSVNPTPSGEISSPAVTPSQGGTPTPSEISSSPIVTPSEEVPSSPVISESPTPIVSPTSIKPASKDILLTEINTGTKTANRAVEISNIGDEDIDLDGYALNIYRTYSDEPTDTIPLSGTINAHSAYVIAYSSASKDILDKADLVTYEYLNDGTFPVSISYHEEVIDAIGIIGFNYDFAKNAVLVRKQEYFTQSVTFDIYRWIRYPTNTIETLGNYHCVSDEVLANGPKLTSEDFSKPFCSSADQGDGGVIRVTLGWTSDGDTTGFNYGNAYSEYGVSGSLSTRYYGINTPEIAHSATETSDPYGDEAKEFTNNILRNSKSFLVQSVNGYNIHETYGRMLGYVWVSDKTNPNPEDYTLLNFLIVRNGFSHPAFVTRNADYNNLMTYQGVSFIEYLFDADNYAEYHQLNIHSGGNNE